MKNQIAIKCDCGEIHVWWHDCPIQIPLGPLSIQSNGNGIENEDEADIDWLVKAWNNEGHDVMFNKARDDLTPAQRVGKWLREATRRAHK